MPDNRYEGMFIRQDIENGNRVWKVFCGEQLIATASSQTEAENKWLEYKYGGKHGHTRIGDIYR
jgi:hypothetical protein